MLNIGHQIGNFHGKLSRQIFFLLSMATKMVAAGNITLMKCLDVCSPNSLKQCHKKHIGGSTENIQGHVDIGPKGVKTQRRLRMNLY